jgi:hypothetical protein
MAVSLRVLRGLAAAIPTLADGEFYFATDTKNLYMGLSGVNYLIGGTSLPPSGAAGGNLAGTYPNPTFNTAVVTAAALTVLDDTTVAAMVDTLGGATSTGTGGLVRASGPTLVAPLLGTPASGVATNLTGTAAGLTAGNVTTNANLTGPVTSSGNATSLAADFVIPTVITVPNTGLHLLDTDASHDLIIKPGSNITADRTLTVTTGDSNRTLTFSGNLNVTGDAEVQGINTGDNLFADQSSQETGTSTTAVITPSVQQYHQSACKGWVNFNGTGTIAVRGSYNVTSLTDGGVGVYTINWATDFSSANQCSVVSAGTSGARRISDCPDTTAGTTRIVTTDTTHAVADSDFVFAASFGDQ